MRHFFNDGSGRNFDQVAFGMEDGISYGVGAGDVNGDGYPDVGIANSNGLNLILINRSASNQ